MSATPFSARHSQPTLSALMDLQPHLYRTPAIAMLSVSFSEETPTNFGGLAN
jgi:hypothetical protein